MAKIQPFSIISFEDLRKRNEEAAKKDYYKPDWDQGKGVIRMANVWGERLGAERGDLIKVTHKGLTATYTLKMSPFLTADVVALDYDQQRQLELVRLKEPVSLRISRSGHLGTFSFLWKHVDPSIRLPFRISIWLTLIGLVVGAMLGVAVDRVFS